MLAIISDLFHLEKIKNKNMLYKIVLKHCGSTLYNESVLGSPASLWAAITYTSN